MAQYQLRLPVDQHGNAVQALTPGTPANAAVSGSSAVLALPSGAQVVEIGCSTDAWLLFTTSGGSVSSSTGMFFPKGASVYVVPTDATHVAHIQDSAAGRISLTKLS